MAEESASPNVSAPRPILRAVTSIITVRLRPERPAAVLGSGGSTRAVRRSPVPWPPWSAPSGAATAATSPPLLREALASAADTGVAAVCPRPESPEAMLGSSNSTCTVRRLPVGPDGAATTTTSGWGRCVTERQIGNGGDTRRMLRKHQKLNLKRCDFKSLFSKVPQRAHGDSLSQCRLRMV